MQWFAMKWRITFSWLFGGTGMDSVLYMLDYECIKGASDHEQKGKWRMGHDGMIW
jgi:hypothetical protein